MHSHQDSTNNTYTQAQRARGREMGGEDRRGKMEGEGDIEREGGRERGRYREGEREI